MKPKPVKICVACGREIQWRKKWERDWDNVKYCSDACRRRSSRDDDATESAILNLLAERAKGATICPGEVARLIFPSDWNNHMEAVRMAARRLVASGNVVITQRGKIVDPSNARGPIRIRLN